MAGYPRSTSARATTTKLTTQIKSYPFAVFNGGTPPNAVLAEQLAEVHAKMHALIG